MLWIVLPRSAIDLIPTVEIGFVKVRLIKVVLNVLVIVVHVFVIHVDVNIATAPPAVPTPATTPRRSKRDTCPERNRCTGGIISWRWVSNRRVRISRRAINYGWVIRGNVNNVGLGLLHDDNLFTSTGSADSLRLHRLLCRGF
jgi:hypothetical protein